MKRPELRHAYRAVLFLLGLIAAGALGGSAGAQSRGSLNPCHQTYPNISGEVLLENDKLVVQRFVFPPGQWEGVHTHPGDQLFIHLKGGEWTVRYGKRQTTSYSETGSVGWFSQSLPISADHESVNSGTEPIELIWVTLKTKCAGNH